MWPRCSGTATPLAPWQLADDDRRLIAALRPLLPAATSATDLIPVAIAALGAADEHRGDRRPDAVRRAGARMLAGSLALLNLAAGVAGAATTTVGPRGRADEAWWRRGCRGRGHRPAAAADGRRRARAR